MGEFLSPLVQSVPRALVVTHALVDAAQCTAHVQRRSQRVAAPDTSFICLQEGSQREKVQVTLPVARVGRFLRVRRASFGTLIPCRRSCFALSRACSLLRTSLGTIFATAGLYFQPGE